MFCQDESLKKYESSSTHSTSEPENEEKSLNKVKEKKENEETTNNIEQDNNEDEFNPTLAAMEEEIKPKVLKTISDLTKNYNKLIKYQNERLNAVLETKKNSPGKEKGYKKIIDEILQQIKSLQLSPSILEELVQSHYVENKKIISLEGVLLRLAMDNNISRNEFVKFYVGNEINPNLKSFLDQNSSWKDFFRKNKNEIVNIRERLVELSKKLGI